MTLPGILASGGLAPGAPTIGTATDGGNGTSVSVAFTAPSWVGKGTGTVTYTATSSPGGLTGTSTSSPITVSGLTTGTAYTFTVRATTSYGITGPASAASNSVTPAVPGAYDSIASATPNGTSTVTFSSIPQTFTHLQLRIMARDTQNFSSVNICLIRLNNDSNNSYYNNYIIATGNNVNATNNYGDSTTMWGLLYGATTSYDNIFGVTVMDILDYTNTNKRKTVRANMGANNTEANTNNEVRLVNWTYQSTSAINTITITANVAFAAGTIISLYGIRG